MPNHLLAGPVCCLLMDAQITVSGLLWYWRKLRSSELSFFYDLSVFMDVYSGWISEIIISSGSVCHLLQYLCFPWTLQRPPEEALVNCMLLQFVSPGLKWVWLLKSSVTMSFSLPCVVFIFRLNSHINRTGRTGKKQQLCNYDFMHIAPLKTEFTRHIDTDAGNAGINATVKAKRKKPSQEKSEQECKTQKCIYE